MYKYISVTRGRHCPSALSLSYATYCTLIFKLYICHFTKLTMKNYTHNYYQNQPYPLILILYCFFLYVNSSAINNARAIVHVYRAGINNLLEMFLKYLPTVMADEFLTQTKHYIGTLTNRLLIGNDNSQ